MSLLQTTYSDYSFIFLLGHTCRFILGILFPDRRLHIASILVDISVVLSKLVVLIYGVLITSLSVPGIIRLLHFLRMMGPKWQLPVVFFGLLGIEPHDTILLLHIFVLAVSLCLGCSLVSPVHNLYFPLMIQTQNFL